MNAEKENEKNGDIELIIRQFTENEEIPRAPMNISVDYLSYLIIKPDNSLWKINIPEELDPNAEFLFGIRKIQNNTYKIINSLKISNQTKKTEKEIQNLRKKLWYLVNSDEDKDKINEDYILNENDIIKLGDCLFEVIKKQVKKNDNNKINNNNNSKNKDLYDISSLNNNFGPVFNIDRDKGDKNEQNNQTNQSNINNENNKINSTIKDNSKNTNISENPILKLCDCYNHFECIKSQLFNDLKMKQKLEELEKKKSN